MVYKIRVILDTKEDIFRDVEIKEKQTLWNLHNGIKKAFNLKEDELSTFNLLENDGTVIKSVPLEDLSDEGDGEIMSDIYISEAFEKKGDKAQFQYGFLDLWEFFCEFIEEVEEKKSINYPVTTYRFGNAPLKAPGKTGGSASAKKVVNMDDFGLDDFESADFSDENDDFEENDYNDDYDDDLD